MWQTREVWDYRRKSYFIDSLLRGFSTPKIHLRSIIRPRSRTSVYEVIDGQQRLRAIKDFLDDKLKVSPRDNEKFADTPFSSLHNLLLYLLSLSDNPEVIEAFGRNQLLYLADKAVKLRVKRMRSTLRGVADLELSSLARRERIFTILSSHRDMRADSELRRTRFARKA